MLFLLILIILIKRKINENFLNNKMISYQTCGVLVNTFPTFLHCNHFKQIINSNIKTKGVNYNKPLILKLKDNSKINLNVNTYKLNKKYNSETTNCKMFIDWIMNYCRFSL